MVRVEVPLLKEIGGKWYLVGIGTLEANGDYAKVFERFVVGKEVSLDKVKRFKDKLLEEYKRSSFYHEGVEERDPIYQVIKNLDVILYGQSIFTLFVIFSSIGIRGEYGNKIETYENLPLDVFDDRDNDNILKNIIYPLFQEVFQRYFEKKGIKIYDVPFEEIKKLVNTINQEVDKIYGYTYIVSKSFEVFFHKLRETFDCKRE